METTPFDSKLHEVNGKINRTHAVEFLIFIVAGLLALWTILTALDVWLRPRGWVRMTLGSIVLVAALAGLFFLIHVLLHKRSTAAVAAFLEKHFPQLDNNLINRVLFSEEPSKNPWLQTYLRQGVPMLDTLPLKEIKNKSYRKYGFIGVALALLVLLLPIVFWKDAWTIAMRRMINPLSQLSPPTFARVIEVIPANKAIVQGEGINLAVRAKGLSGQKVFVDLYPADDRRSTVLVGEFKSSDQEETFAYRVSKVSTALGYRFTVGDAYPTDKYQIKAVPPLALTAFTLKATPPRYTALHAATFNALTNALTIPEDSEIETRITCNREVVEATLAVGTNKLSLTSKDKKNWASAFTVSESGVLTISAKDSLGLSFEMPVRYDIVSDLTPSVHLVTPSPRHAVLPLNTKPVLVFDVADDYGLSKVVLERVKRGAKSSERGTVVKTWDAANAKKFSQKWDGSIEDVDLNSALRIVAYDAKGEAHFGVSPSVTLEMKTQASQYQADDKNRQKVRASIARLLTEQIEARKVTAGLGKALPTFEEEDWKKITDKQKAIRAVAADIAKTQGDVLGAAGVALGKALRGPFPEAVIRLNRTVTGEAGLRSTNAVAAVDAQDKIISLLKLSDNAANKGDVAKDAAGLAAMIEAIKKGQTDVLRLTERHVKNASPKLPEGIIDREDSLAQDTDAMLAFCREAAKNNQNGGDKEAAKIMGDIVAKATDLKIHPSMLAVSEQLDTATYKNSIAPQQSITNNLASLMDVLRSWRDSDIKENTEEALAAVRDARDSIKKLTELQKQIVDTLRNTGSQGNKTEKIDEETLEEILELKGNMADAMLKVATDLQAFPELDSVNELVTDAYQSYEEMKQEEGTDNGTNKVVETGLQKEDFLLETMAQTGQKAEEMEQFLGGKPDAVKRDTEQFDKEEMADIGQVTMPEELQDIVGDLLEQEEKEQQKADDSTTNQGMSNPDMGWGIAEGETVDYSAAGKSGNERPEHKDQDGRSQVGRQGMADGEVMAKSGKINEGDKNIDKRKTADSNQSGNVEEEGHSEAVASGGGKNSGYAKDKGMEGGKNATRRDTKVQSDDNAKATESQFTRNAQTLYTQATKNGLKTANLKDVIALGKARDYAIQQKAAPGVIAEFTTNIVKQLTILQASLESGNSSRTMGASSATGDSDISTTAANPDEAPPEYKEMVSDYFKALGKME